jgi:hypothetical protein
MRIIVRTYSAGVHIGTLAFVNPNNSKELMLRDAVRLWKWEGGGLSLSAISQKGMKGGRTDYTSEVFITEAIEYIPVTQDADATFRKYLDK